MKLRLESVTTMLVGISLRTSCDQSALMPELVSSLVEDRCRAWRKDKVVHTQRIARTGASAAITKDGLPETDYSTVPAAMIFTNVSGLNLHDVNVI